MPASPSPRSAPRTAHRLSPRCLRPPSPAPPRARSGEDIIITGSIDHMLAGAMFSGPNRSEKQDRLRPVVSVMEFTSGFSDIRAHLAELRAPKVPAPAPKAAPTTEPIVVASLE